MVRYFSLAVLSASFNFWDGVHRADVIGGVLIGLGENGWKILEAERYCGAAAFFLAGCSCVWRWKKEFPCSLLGLLLAASDQVTNRNWARDPNFGGMLLMSKLMFWMCNAMALLLLVVTLFMWRANIWVLIKRTERT